jgi:predicted nuclease of predicted toxin-antitoxin system
VKVLLDHCMPRPFERALPLHEAVHTSRLGWGHLENGKLLSIAEENGFSVMVTVDQNMPFQQVIANRNLCVILLKSHSNSIRALMPFGPFVEAALKGAKPGTLIELRIP